MRTVAGGDVGWWGGGCGYKEGDEIVRVLNYIARTIKSQSMCLSALSCHTFMNPTCMHQPKFLRKDKMRK